MSRVVLLPRGCRSADKNVSLPKCRHRKRLPQAEVLRMVSAADARCFAGGSQQSRRSTVSVDGCRSQAARGEGSANQSELSTARCRPAHPTRDSDHGNACLLRGPSACAKRTESHGCHVPSRRSGTSTGGALSRYGHGHSHLLSELGRDWYTARNELGSL